MFLKSQKQLLKQEVVWIFFLFHSSEKNTNIFGAKNQISVFPDFLLVAKPILPYFICQFLMISKPRDNNISNSDQLTYHMETYQPYYRKERGGDEREKDRKVRKKEGNIFTLKYKIHKHFYIKKPMNEIFSP